FISTNTALKLDQNLEIVDSSSATFWSEESVPYSFGEGFVMNDTIYLMYGEILESYDSDFSLLNIYDYGRRIENTDIVKIGSNNWTIGYSVDFENPHESSTILKSVILIRN